MDLQTAIDGALVMVLLLDLGLLTLGRLATAIKALALQCLVLAPLPLAAEAMHGSVGGHGWLILGATIGLKVFLIPWVLLRAIRTGEIHREIEPLVGFTASLAIGAGLLAVAFAVGGGMRAPGLSISPLLAPAGLGTVAIGLLIMISRVKAITQVVGYLVVENGVYIFGLLLVGRMPALVEMGILLDLFVAVFIMAIVVHHIRRTFDHIDTHLLGGNGEASS